MRKDLVDTAFAACERYKRLYAVSIPMNGYATDKIFREQKQLFRHSDCNENSTTFDIEVSKLQVRRKIGRPLTDTPYMA